MKRKDYLLAFPSKHNHLQVIIRQNNLLSIGQINLKEDYECRYGCSHWTTDYCECKCHEKDKNLFKKIKQNISTDLQDGNAND